MVIFLWTWLYACEDENKVCEDGIETREDEIVIGEDEIVTCEDELTPVMPPIWAIRGQKEKRLLHR